MTLPRLVCRHDSEPAASVARTPSGCVAFPDDVQQLLCAQHTLSLPDGTADNYSLVWVHPALEEWMCSHGWVVR